MAFGPLSRACRACPELLRGGEASKPTVQSSDIYTVNVAQAQASPRQHYYLFPMFMSKKTLVQSYTEKDCTVL